MNWLDLGKIDDFIKFPLDFGAFHAQDGAVEINILAPGQFRMKTGANFQQRAHPPVDFTFAFGWIGDPRKNAQQRAFSGSVAAHNPQHLARLNIKGNMAQRPDLVPVHALIGDAFAISQPADAIHGPAPRARQGIAQGGIPRCGRPNAVLFA